MNAGQIIKATVNFKFSFLKRSFQGKPFRLLDVGSGNHSASRIHAIFPECEYHGLDLDKNYNNDERDFKVMKQFYELDLTTLDYPAVPDNYFDGIWMAHVIEHLPNGDKVVGRLLEKLKSGGYFYIEYPGLKSTRLPSMYGSLNFYDDASHVRLYSVKELSALFREHNCTVLACGTRRNWYYILAMPLLMLKSLVKRRRLEGYVFWDLLGFAEFLYVRKN